MTEKYRQRFHIEPPDGWLNDPNGLCFFDGEYHVYFQYSPGTPDGSAQRCWGHYAGKNLLQMRYRGIVLKPDIPEDRDGAYSGSAAVRDGILHIFYTGNVKEAGEHDGILSGRGANVIHVTSADGQHMGKKRTVLRNADYPGFCSCHVRDPKVWEENGKWYMVLGARTKRDEGCVLFYESDDLEKWSYVNLLTKKNFGYMWECPDFFRIGERAFLSVSPQGLMHSDIRYQNVYQSGYFMIGGEGESGMPKAGAGAFREWDMGFDFYAPQTFKAPDGRRLLIGWMGIGDSDYVNHTTELGWQHCLTLPREIDADGNGVLRERPIREMMMFRGGRTQIAASGNAAAYGEHTLPFDLHAAAGGGFEISLDDKLHMRYSEEEKRFTLTFSDEFYGGGRTVRNASVEQCADIRVIADMSSLEIYLNDGLTVMSTRFYPQGGKVRIGVEGLTADVWELGR